MLIIFFDENELAAKADALGPIADAIEGELKAAVARLKACPFKGDSAMTAEQVKLAQEPVRHTREGWETKRAPWYEPLKILREGWTCGGGSSPALNTMDQLIMLGELGLTQEKALEAVYRCLGNGYFTSEKAAS